MHAGAGGIDGDGHDELVLGLTRNGGAVVRAYRWSNGAFTAVGALALVISPRGFESFGVSAALAPVFLDERPLDDDPQLQAVDCAGPGSFR